MGGEKKKGSSRLNELTHLAMRSMIWRVLFGRVARLALNRNSEVVLPFHLDLHRASRFPFAASIELADVRSERLLTARTANLSLFGCYVYTTGPFSERTKVLLKITHGGITLAAFR
jgi:hypothetical protein